VRKITLCAVLVLAAASAYAKVLVEIPVADVADFEAFRADRDGFFIFVNGYAYTAVDDGAVVAFDADGRTWGTVATAAGGEVFLVLPAVAQYDGPRREERDVAGGNHLFVLAEADAAALAPLYAYNVVDVWRPVSPRALPAMPFNPLEATAAERVRRDRLMATVTRLQDFYSRYVYYHGNDAAASFLEEEYENIFRTSVERQYFEVSTHAGVKNIPNVIARIEGLKYPEQEIVVGAHFDSYTFDSSVDPGAVAPGADDNASGTAAVLECARVLSNYAFDRTLVFVAFNAEEVGLFGSEYYATTARARGDDIRAMINLDMVAYESDGVPDALAGGNSPSYHLAELMAAKAAKYTSVKMEASGGGLGHSDHAPFWKQGYEAIMESEGRNDFNPYIHGDGDTVEVFDTGYFTEMTMILVATVFDLADLNTSPLMGIIEPDGTAYADVSYTVRWWDVDADDIGRDAAISLYWAADTRAEGGTLIADGIPQNDAGNRGSYEWDTSSLPPGRYYVYGVIDDGFNEPCTSAAAGPLYITHESRVVAYPNPVRSRDGRAEVTFDGLLPGDEVTVFDLAGTVVFEAASRGRELVWDASGAASGVYFYRVESDVMADAVTGKVAILK
jgi:hypothetical protein